jgi:hypothetical protein
LRRREILEPLVFEHIDEKVVRQYIKKAMKMVDDKKLESLEVIRHFRTVESPDQTWAVFQPQGLSLRVIYPEGDEAVWTTLSREEYEEEIQWIQNKK